MIRSYSPNGPRLALRKPLTSPAGFSVSTPPGQVFTSNGAPVSPNGLGPVNSPVIRDTSVESGSMSQVKLCSYCGQQGNFRCKRCKITTYCSAVCQTEDWKTHRHICKPVDPHPAKDTQKEGKTMSLLGESAGPLVSKCDASNPQKSFLKNLCMPEVMKGTELQASVVEFYSPSRFFLLPFIPELLTNLQTVSTELEKMYRSPSTTTYIPYVGEVCAVQFSCDLNWYRGLTQNVSTDRTTASILYIDFGNEEDVPVDRIKPLAANIQPFCPCAMECRIAGVVPVGGKWSEKCCIAVRQLLVNKTVTVKIMTTVEKSQIRVVDIMLSVGKLLSMFLIEQGYAAEETIDITPTPQEIQAMENASLETFRRLCDGMDDNKWAEPPKPLTQAVGDSFAVVVTHLQSPSEIIVQKVENAGVIQELQLKLREHCCQANPPQNFRPAPGTVCCAQFSEVSVFLPEDKQWYRAKILAYSSEEHVCIGYLDFGNSEEVDLSHLQPISPSLLSLPMQAMPCSLAGVQPAGESWSEECVIALQRRVSNRILWVEIQGELEGRALVAMIDKGSDPQADIAELLSSAGFSAPIIRSSNQQADHTNFMSTPACEHLVWSYASIPSDGQTVSLHISDVKNPHEFHCYIDNPTDHQRLMELEAALNEHCKVDSSAFEPKVGEPCCVMFPADGPLHRVMVKELSEDKAVVKFLDVGHSMQLEKKLLRSITPGLLTLPFQAISCSLAGAEPLGSEWSSEAVLGFQTLVVGQQLSASVLSVSEQGYCVKLKSRGQDVAAALISKQLAKAPGGISKETNITTGSEDRHRKKVKGDNFSQINTPMSNYTGASSKETVTATAATLSEAPSFPVDWDTVKLPLNETFQPYIAAGISPSLFYLLFPKQVSQEELQGLMTDLTTYCNKVSLSSAVSSRPAPGAACCAQFSADNNWYRAVVLEVGETEVSVIYADYGNTEKVPISRILPIPMHLLQLPFQITRCSLTGKERFPAKRPEEINQIFQSLLSKGVFATTESFDGSANVISLALQPEKGGKQLTALILDALQSQAKSNPNPSTTQKEPQIDRVRLSIGLNSSAGTCCASVEVQPECLQAPKTQKEPDNKTTPAETPEQAHWTPKQNNGTNAASCNEGHVQKIAVQIEPPCTSPIHTAEPPTTGCCCLSLKTKIDVLEQLARMQLSLIEQLVGQK